MVECKQTSITEIVIQVELFGQARIVCGRRQIEVAVPERADIGDVVEALAKACPGLVGTAIHEGRSRLLESYNFNLNGLQFVTDERLHIRPGDVVLLFSSQAGG